MKSLQNFKIYNNVTIKKFDTYDVIQLNEFNLVEENDFAIDCRIFSANDKDEKNNEKNLFL